VSFLFRSASAARAAGVSVAFSGSTRGIMRLSDGNKIRQDARPHQHFLSRLGGYVRMFIEDRREVVSELINNDGLTQQETAEILGTSQATVSNDLSELINQADPAQDAHAH
jgi:DNA-directed RNA polymerase specialized sigma subunit